MKSSFNWKYTHDFTNLAFKAMYTWVTKNRNRFQGVEMIFSIYSVGRCTSYFVPHGIQWLYYFFDTYDMSICISPNLSGFKIYNSKDSNVLSSTKYDSPLSRIEIEMDAFIDAFHILHNNLSKEQNDNR